MKLTEEEKTWIDGVKNALKNCPKGISLQIDDEFGDDGKSELMFLKKVKPGTYYGVGRSKITVL